MFWLVAAVVAVAALIGLFYPWRKSVLDKRALEEVMNSLRDVRIVDWYSQSKGAWVRAVASRMLRGGPFTAEEYDWMREHLNYALQDRWMLFEERCDEQNRLRNKIKRALDGDRGGMTSDQIDALYAKRERVDREVIREKDYFWKLHATVRRLGLSTWPDGGAYMLLIRP